MPGIPDRIAAYLRAHPEGVDDGALALALSFNRRQEANSYCRRMAQEGVIERRSVSGKIRNFPKGATSSASAPDRPATASVAPDKPWYWEGNVQARVVARLRRDGYAILRVADTAKRERGKDIEAAKGNTIAWISVKGYPTGTLKTKPTNQASKWLDALLYDLVNWRGQTRDVELAIALPDFPRYRELFEKIRWIQPVIRFSVYWVSETEVAFDRV